MTYTKRHKSKIHILHTFMTHTQKWNLNPTDSFFISWIIQHFFPVWFPYIQQKQILTRDFFCNNNRAIIRGPTQNTHRHTNNPHLIHFHWKNKIHTSYNPERGQLLVILNSWQYGFRKRNELMHLSYSTAYIFIFPVGHLRRTIWQISNKLMRHHTAWSGTVSFVRINFDAHYMPLWMDLLQCTNTLIEDTSKSQTATRNAVGGTHITL